MKKKFKLRKMSRISVVYLILIVNLFSITALSLFNYFVFHNNSKKSYEESFLEYYQNVTETAFYNIDQQIMQVMYNIPKLYFSQAKHNEPILRPQEENIVGNTAAIQDLVNTLQFIKVSYPIVKSMDIYYEASGAVVTGFSNVHFPEDDDEVNRYLPWYREFDSLGRDLYFMGETSEIYPIHEPVVTYVRRIQAPIWGDKDIVSAIHISSSVFSNYINEEIGCLKVSEKDGRILYESEKLEESGDGDTTEFSYVSTLTGLNYTYSIENSLLFTGVNDKNRIFLFNFLVSILFNIGLLLAISWYSGGIYRKKLEVLSEETGVSIEGERKSFDSSLKQLQEGIITLHHTADSSKALRFQSAVRSLILNRKADETYELLSPYLEYQRCRIIIMKSMEPEKYSLEQMQKQFDAWSGEAGYHVLLTSMEQGEQVAVLNVDMEKEMDALAEIIERLKLCTGGCRITVGISVPAERDEIRKAYRRVCEAAKYQYIFQEQQVLWEDELKIGKRKNSGSHLKLFEAVEKDINSENLLEFKMHIEMLAVSFKSGNYTMSYCYSTLRDLVTLVYQVIQHRGLDMWVMYGYDIREYYKKIPDIESFQEWMDSICEILLRNIRQKRKALDEDGDLKVQLTKLIDENLENDISLDFLCDKLSMRPDVLSRTFKQVMGEGYTEYVKKKKLDRAVELMDEDYSMKDIAQRLGYSSAQYFIKIFKEAYGTTPYQYKKNKRNDEK